jgi:threonine aldolase
LLTNPGEEMICDKWAHVHNYEAGGAAFHSGVTSHLVDGDRGLINAELVEKAIRPPEFIHNPKTSLVCLENTTNKGGGACYDLKTIEEIAQVVQKHNLKLHLDGARLFNALVAKNQDPKAMGKHFDTISICLSKGLGCPMGTVLLGDTETMLKAVRVRKIMGGGMRQVGFMAAAGIYALDNHVERLQDDHDKAAELADCLSEQNYVKEVEPVETNIVIFYLEDGLDPDKFLNDLESEKLRISDMGEGKLRMVTHLDYGEKQHCEVKEIFKEMDVN